MTSTDGTSFATRAKTRTTSRTRLTGRKFEMCISTRVSESTCSSRIDVYRDRS